MATSEPLRVEVQGCCDEMGLPLCPFDSDEVGYCLHPAAPYRDEQDGYDPTPDWCPLREQPVLVVLAENR